jgi:hypothetical protein
MLDVADDELVPNLLVAEIGSGGGEVRENCRAVAERVAAELVVF